jgi:predicted DNA binding CopG/RHH family protein
MPKKLRKIPQFKNEEEERKFWTTHSSADYIDWSKAKRAIFPDLKPSSRRPISIRLPEHLIDAVKMQAHKLNVPYQSLMKQYIAEGAFRK